MGFCNKSQVFARNWSWFAQRPGIVIPMTTTNCKTEARRNEFACRCGCDYRPAYNAKAVVMMDRRDRHEQAKHGAERGMRQTMTIADGNNTVRSSRGMA